MWIFSAFITIWMNKYESDQLAPPYARIKKFPCIMQLKIYWLSRLFNAEIFRNMLNALLVQVCFKQTVIRCIIKENLWMTKSNIKKRYQIVVVLWLHRFFVKSVKECENIFSEPVIRCKAGRWQTISKNYYTHYN